MFLDVFLDRWGGEGLGLWFRKVKVGVKQAGCWGCELPAEGSDTRTPRFITARLNQLTGEAVRARPGDEAAPRVNGRPDDDNDEPHGRC